MIYDAYFTRVELEQNVNQFAHIFITVYKKNERFTLYDRRGRIGTQGEVLRVEKVNKINE